MMVCTSLYRNVLYLEKQNRKTESYYTPVCLGKMYGHQYYKNGKGV